MAGNVSRRSGSVTTSTPSPSCRRMGSSCPALVAITIRASMPDSCIWRYTRCTMDSRAPPASVSRLRNCLERVSLERGHRRFPEPPDNRMMFMISSDRCRTMTARVFLLL